MAPQLLLLNSWTQSLSFNEGCLLIVFVALVRSGIIIDPIKFAETVQLVHLVYNRLEIDPSNIPATFSLLVFLPLIGSLAVKEHLSNTLYATVVSSLVFYTTLGTSIVLYRLSPIHPLANYPGPILAKVSKFWGTWLSAGGKTHVVYQRLHERYGPYIRVGTCTRQSSTPWVPWRSSSRTEWTFIRRCRPLIPNSRSEGDAKGPEYVVRFSSLADTYLNSLSLGRSTQPKLLQKPHFFAWKQGTYGKTKAMEQSAQLRSDKKLWACLEKTRCPIRWKISGAVEELDNYRPCSLVNVFRVRRSFVWTLTNLWHKHSCDFMGDMA